MSEINPDDIRRIAEDRSFQALMGAIKTQAIKRILARTTTPEDREAHLADYHAVERLEAKIRAEANPNGADDG